MLQQLSAQVADCLTRAQIAHERSDKATDPILKQDYLDMEQSWLLLAKSYQTVKRLGDFIDSADARLATTRSRLASN